MAMNKSAEAFRTIGEVATELGIPKHVLRFWEGRFPQIRPMKRGGGRRYYRPEDMELLRGIRALLHTDGYTNKGHKKILRYHGDDQLNAAARATPEQSHAAATRTGRKRGRKPVVRTQTKKADTVPPSSASDAVEAQPNGAGAACSSPQLQIRAALRELEIARAILLGRPPDPAAASDAKKARAGTS
jgi:DNA-binding transcriptional MerR regulator